MVLKLRHRSAPDGQYIFCRVFAGKDRDHLQAAGQLILTRREFPIFLGTLKLGSSEACDGLELGEACEVLTEEEIRP